MDCFFFYFSGLSRKCKHREEVGEVASPSHLLKEQMAPQLISPCFPLSVEDTQPSSENTTSWQRCSWKIAGKFPVLWSHASPSCFFRSFILLTEARCTATAGFSYWDRQSSADTWHRESPSGRLQTPHQVSIPWGSSVVKTQTHHGSVACLWNCEEEKSPSLTSLSSPSSSQLILFLLCQREGPLPAALLQCLFKRSVKNKDLPPGFGRQLLHVN